MNKIINWIKWWFGDDEAGQSLQTILNKYRASRSIEDARMVRDYVRNHPEETTDEIGLLGEAIFHADHGHGNWRAPS